MTTSATVRSAASITPPVAPKMWPAPDAMAEPVGDAVEGLLARLDFRAAMLDALANRAGTNVRIVTVSQDSGAPEKVQAFLDQRGFARLPAWLDPENDLSFHYATGTLPTTILYDSQGREVWRYVGGHDWSGAQAARLLDEAR